MDNPQAFPRNASDCEALQAGMTLRDWFAGQALITTADRTYIIGMNAISPVNSAHPEVAVERAYAYADAMLAERAKSTPTAVADKGEGF